MSAYTSSLIVPPKEKSRLVVQVGGGSIPVLPSLDPVDRDVECALTKCSNEDPRTLLCGRPLDGSSASAAAALDESTSSLHAGAGGSEGVQSQSEWVSGLFDRGSFEETMGGWAQTSVVGRARLGGIPLGVLTAETRTVSLHIPADPARPSSEAQSVQQAGHVFYPDSAFKTAQAIEDFDHEGLPLCILANWRGFCSGMKEMYEQVLVFGAQIVRALLHYTQPVLIYVYRGAELRGGAWAVLGKDFLNLFQ